jgi:DNA-binding beta-propeller fold protein YncE
MALSPGGSALFVTGQDFLRGKTAYGTVAFSTATGAKLWSRQAALNGFGLPADIAVNPAGSQVFVTGYTANPKGSSATEYATVAYAAGSGGTLWTRLYPGPVTGFSQATGVAVTPDGTKVLVTGFSQGPNQSPGQGDFATIAYRP